MSRIALDGNAGGTGTFTITSPNSNNNRTLTLPDSSGTMLTTGDTIPVAQGGTGATTLTANNVLLGNGTSAVQVVAPGTNGNILTSNGTTWTSAAPASSYVGARSTIYTSGTNTFTIPAGITALKVTVIGGGGGGGSAQAVACAFTAGGGGGGGGFVQRWITGQTPGSTVTVTVGAGGSGGTGGAGTAGGTSSFGAFASATGGGGGTRGVIGAQQGTAGANGTGSSGDINLPGFRPTVVTTHSGSNLISNGGWAALYGIGGTYAFAANGAAGTGYGAGGGGGHNNGEDVQRSGGNGAGGIVIIEY